MKSVGIRGSVVAAVASIFVLGYGIMPQSHAQQTAPAADSELAARGIWNAGTTYAKDDIVTARGSAWISLRPGNINHVPGQTSAPSSATWWRLFARGFNPTGAWLNSTQYHPDDLVTRSGQTYRAKLSHTGKPPTNTNFWELLAQKGDPGPNTGIGAGTASMPSISFNGDADTGIFSPAAGKIALVANGELFLHNKGTSNTALGTTALTSNTTGESNTAVGQAGLASNTSGHSNTAVGHVALSANTTGIENTAVGYRALRDSNGGFNTGLGAFVLASNTTGNNNTAVGRGALAGNTSGNENTAVGASALGANTGGIGNTAVGYRALLANTTGNNNLAIGTEVLHVNTTGSFNIALGSGAGGGNTTADSNVAIGINALSANQVGAFNVAIGHNALTYVTTTGNTAVGYQALYLNTTGAGNVAVGTGTLAAGTSAAGNVAVGADALGQNNTGDGNIAIGYLAGYSANNPTDSIFIGNSGSGADDNVIRIGTAAAQTSTYIAGIFNRSVDGTTDVPVIIDGDGKLGTTVSSRRYKFDIEPMADMSAMLGKLRPVTFRYKEAQNGRHPLQYGLIAEEVAEVFPDLAVFNKEGGVDTVKYQLLPSFLLAGYQAQQNMITAQADELRQQKDVSAAQAGEIADLKDRLRRLEALLPQTKAALQ
jgi:hypothetical protein